VTPTEARKLAEEYFGKWTASGGTVEAPTAPAAPSGRSWWLTARIAAKRCDFRVGMPAPIRGLSGDDGDDTMLGGLSRRAST